MTGFKFNQNVNVAIRPKILAQNRAEKGKFSDMVLPAKFSNLLLRDKDFQITHGITNDMIIANLSAPLQPASLSASS